MGDRIHQCFDAGFDGFPGDYADPRRPRADQQPCFGANNGPSLRRRFAPNCILFRYVHARRMRSNFSEGRDKPKVDAIVDAMKMPGVYLLDREMDSDHNRCVITLARRAQKPSRKRQFGGVGKASELIDLNTHAGAHPRMGAADVVRMKFPSTASPSKTAWPWPTTSAKRSGSASKFRSIYEAAARAPERQGLENIRRGQFEGVRAEVATNPARCPDFGDPCVHPTAGSTSRQAHQVSGRIPASSNQHT